ncbi:MAG: hypothetical protein KFB96_04010 [Thiocapsa sp.]|uniref:hypothetical protein n=1 Tax=Thiocapsa sp. TaxID=2024551 RepID=UPI001BCB7E3B|nr:hypothetical protein [Thiocapsa sp.]QVL49678.1 MAG: hypothetical protein KFB96_04010 [Thiocapsa sp.]
MRLIDLLSSAFGVEPVAEAADFAGAFLADVFLASALTVGILAGAGVIFFVAAGFDGAGCAGLGFAAMPVGFTDVALVGAALSPALGAAVDVWTVFFAAVFLMAVLLSAAALGAVFFVTIVLLSAMSLARLLDSGVVSSGFQLRPRRSFDLLTQKRR